jgi:hypothetical protein
MTFNKKYSHSDGIDIKGTYENKYVASFSFVSYQIYRDMAPIYTMGNVPPPKPKKRIGGTLEFTQFNLEPFCNKNYPTALPKFDIVLTCTNEYGYVARFDIEGIQVLYDWKPLHIDDVVISTIFNFTADSLIPWRKQEEDHTGQVYNDYTKRWSWL